MNVLTVIPDDRLFATAPETAAILRCDRRTVLRMLEAGQIPGIKTGRVWRIPTSWLRARAGIGDGDAASA
jgi:excisionase family DNA binding protein